MTKAIRTRQWASGLLMTALAVLGVAVIAPQSRGASVINFDPTGGNGTNPNDVLNTSSFAYLPGNVLAVGGGNESTISIGQSIPVLYQAILGTINTSATGNGNTMSPNANTGNITINPGGGGPAINTNSQIIVQAQFTEQVQNIVTSGSGSTQITTITFAPNLGAGTNLVQLFSQPTAGNANINASNGTGFGTTGGTGATLIMSGTVSSSGFVSSFAENNSSNPVSSNFVSGSGGTYALNQHTGGSGSYGGQAGPPAATQTITGSGSTTLTVNVGFENSSYFLTPGIQFLTLPSVSNGLAFAAVDPLTTMFTGRSPNESAAFSIPGQPAGTAWNGANTPDLLFQSQATNSFSVPEPSSIIMGLIGVGFTTLASIRSLRRRNAAAA
jgi:hypothetical protein